MKKIISNPYVIGFVFGCLALTFIKLTSVLTETAPPPLVDVGEWQLTDHNNNKFGSENLKNKVFVADFFFTSCPSICPHLTKSMSEVQKRYNLNKNKNLKNKINFVSLTVDPGQDTPEVLKRHAIDKKLDLSNWHFLTGSQAELEQVIVSQMKIHMGDKKFEKYEKPDLYDISHMSSLALFDQEGRLRGLFKTDPTGLANLVRAANLLIKLNG